MTTIPKRIKNRTFRFKTRNSVWTWFCQTNRLLQEWGEGRYFYRAGYKFAVYVWNTMSGTTANFPASAAGEIGRDSLTRLRVEPVNRARRISSCGVSAMTFRAQRRVHDPRGKTVELCEVAAEASDERRSRSSKPDRPSRGPVTSRYPPERRSWKRGYRNAGTWFPSLLGYSERQLSALLFCLLTVRDSRRSVSSFWRFYFDFRTELEETRSLEASGAVSVGHSKVN